MIDINECSAGIDWCAFDATCTNTEGGYNCSCDTGFHGDGFSCNSNFISFFFFFPPFIFYLFQPTQLYFYNSVADTDECSDVELNQCHDKATCHDNDGSYECSCHQGFTGNGFNCSGMDTFIIYS